MTKQEKITASNCSKYVNPLHTMFHEAMYEIINSVNPSNLAKWRMADILPTWLDYINTEKDINREASASANTKLLDDSDKKRDQITNYLFETIRIERLYCPDETRAEAARRLWLLTKEYAGLQREGYNEQSVHTDGLVKDLRKTQNYNDLAALGMAIWVDMLEHENTHFKQLLAERSAEKAQTKLPTAKEIRPKTDECYYRVCELLGAAFIYADDDAERERINALVALMNQRTEEIKARHKQRQSTAKKSKTAQEAKAEGE